MRKKSTSSTKSRPKHRTQKYSQRYPIPTKKSGNISSSNLQIKISGQSSISSKKSDKSRDKSSHHPIYYHHHQHTHNHYVHHTTSNNGSSSSSSSSSSSLSMISFKGGISQISCCEFKKMLIYALLFFVAYYLLFLGISMTYKKHKDKYSTLTALDLIDSNGENPTHIMMNGDDGKSQREKFLERKKKRRQERKERLAKLKRAKEAKNKPNCCSVGGGKQKYEILPRFPQLYISDAPYYLDNNLVIIGQLSNAELHLKSILNQLQSISCLYNSSTFILFESNSIDNTTLYLEEFIEERINCSEILYNPQHQILYHNISTLDDLLNIYDTNNYIDDIVYGVLNNYTNINDIDLHEITWYLSEQIRIQNNNKMKEIEIEEILYDKLNAIKYVKYHEKIENHQNYINKYILSGDDIVSSELKIENEILKQLKIYDGVNEHHTALNKDKLYDTLEQIRWNEGNIYKNSDFEDEFNDIHDELEGLIADDEEIIHQKLRDKQLKFAKKRKALRRQRQKEREALEQEINRKEMNGEEEEEENNNNNNYNNNYNNNNNNNYNDDGEEEEEYINDDDDDDDDERLEQQRFDEYYNRFRNRLYRIERFVIYRNMLLNKTQKYSKELDINFDHIMVVDMDIYNIDVRTFMNELYYSSDDINGICIDGIDWMGYTRDTFATVNNDGGWLHYGHNVLINDSEYIYNNQYALSQRKLIPNHEKNRFEAVKSCFGGIVMYKNYNNDLFNSQCRYTLTRDIFYTKYNNTLQATNQYEVDQYDDDDDDDDNDNRLSFVYSYDYWLNNRYHNKYSNQSKIELQLFRDEYIELLQMEDKRIKKRENYPKDGDICEHIPYHYCLNDYGWKFVISSRAKLYYDELYPINRRENDTNWRHYFQNRPNFTK